MAAEHVIQVRDVHPRRLLPVLHAAAQKNGKTFSEVTREAIRLGLQQLGEWPPRRPSGEVQAK